MRNPCLYPPSPLLSSSYKQTFLSPCLFTSSLSTTLLLLHSPYTLEYVCACNSCLSPIAATFSISPSTSTLLPSAFARFVSPSLYCHHMPLINPLLRSIDLCRSFHKHFRGDARCVSALTFRSSRFLRHFLLRRYLHSPPCRSIPYASPVLTSRRSAVVSTYSFRAADTPRRLRPYPDLSCRASFPPGQPTLLHTSPLCSTTLLRVLAPLPPPHPLPSLPFHLLTRHSNLNAHSYFLPSPFSNPSVHGSSSTSSALSAPFLSDPPYCFIFSSFASSQGPFLFPLTLRANHPLPRHLGTPRIRFYYFYTKNKILISKTETIKKWHFNISNVERKNTKK